MRRLSICFIAIIAMSSAACAAVEDEIGSSEHEQRVKPSHLDPNKATSLVVRLPKNAPPLADVRLLVGGAATKFGAASWFEGPIDVEVRLCYGLGDTLCQVERVSLAPKQDATIDLGSLSVLVPAKDPPPAPPEQPDFGPKGYGAATKVQPDWLPRLIVRKNQYTNETTVVVPVQAQGLLPNVAEALGGSNAGSVWAVPVFPATYRFGQRGFDGSTGETLNFQDVLVAPGAVATVNLRRNQYSASVPYLVTIEPPVRELPDAIVQRYDMVIATKNGQGIHTRELNGVFPMNDTNQWGAYYDPIAFPTIGGTYDLRYVFRSLGVSTGSTTNLKVHGLKPLFAPVEYDGAYFLVLNATQYVEVARPTFKPKIGRLDVDDVDVKNEQTGARAVVPGSWRLLNAQDKPVYGDKKFPTNHGLDVLPGNYVVEVSFDSPWTGAQQKRYPVTVQ